MKTGKTQSQGQIPTLTPPVPFTCESLLPTRSAPLPGPVRFTPLDPAAPRSCWFLQLCLVRHEARTSKTHAEGVVLA